MKLKYVLPLLSGMIGALALGAATPDPQQLWDRADREAQWQPVRVQVPGVQGDVNAYRTETGEVKVDTLGERFQSTATLQAAEFKRYTGQTQYLNQCQKQASIFPSIRRLNNKYELSVKVISTRNSGLDYQVADGNGSVAPLANLATQFLAPDHFQLSVQVDPKAWSRVDENFDAVQLQKALSDQVQSQFAEATANGEIKLNLNGMDDLVCDLIAGNARISVQVWYHFSRAKLAHESRLSAAAIGHIYDAIRQHFRAGSDARSNLILGSIQLGVALDRQAPFEPAASDWEVVRLHGLLFDPQQNDLRAMSTEDLARAASRMDRLSDGYTYAIPIFDAAVSSPFATSSGGGQ